MYTAGFTSYGARVCVVKISSYEKQNPQGTISNPNYETAARFENLAQMLFVMDSMYDELNSPQRTMKPRGFTKAEEAKEYGEAETEARALATFKVNVMFRHNASWQGELVWLETRQEAQFRSVLELIMIIDSAFTAIDKEKDS